MVDPEQYISEGLKIIKTLIKQGNLIPAFNACQELLRVNPYHRTVQKYLHDIEELIIQHNERKVDMDIDATMHLWDEKHFDDLLKIYTRLFQFAPNYKRLRTLLQKVNDRMSQEQRNERNEFISKAYHAIEKLHAEKQYAQTIQALNELLSLNPLHENAQKLLKKTKQELVEQKLKENDRLMDSPDFARVLEFYESLLAIDPENKQVKRLELSTKAHLAEQKLLADKIHLNESIARMKELFKSSVFEHVLQSCEEIERLDPGNFTARMYRKKAMAELKNESETQALRLLKENLPLVSEEYAKNQDRFVKV